MASKPANTFRWADNQTSPGAENVEPNESKKDDGWINAEKPRAGYMNWLQNGAFLWFNWLDDLVTSDNGTTAVFDPDRNYKFGATGGAGTEIQLLASGHIVLDGNISQSSGDIFTNTLNCTDGIVNTGDWVVSTGYLSAPNTPDIKHGDRQITIHAFDGAGFGFTANATSGAGYMNSAAGSDKLLIHLPMPAGARLVEVALWVRDSSGVSLTLDVKKQDLSTPTATPGTLGSDTSDTTGTDQQVGVTGLTETVTGDEIVYALVTSGAANHRVYGGHYTYDRL